MIPETIQVGPIRWRVLHTDETTAAMRETSDHPRQMGECDVVSATLTIATGMPPEVTRETLLHEILHAIQAVLGNPVEHKRGADLEEGFVASTSPLLLDTLVRNPGLVTYLLGYAPEPPMPAPKSIF